MAVEMIVDQWNPRQKRYRYETFCYGPKSCRLYKSGPTRKVPGRKGMSWDEEDEDRDVLEGVMLEDGEEIEIIFADAKAVLAEQNLTLKHTAYTLTATGELPPIEEDQVLTLNLDEEESQLEPEELQFLASFYHAKQKYSI